MSLPTYHYRTVRKGLSWQEAQDICAAKLAAHPDKDYRVVRLDGVGSGAFTSGYGGGYRVLLLRDASDDMMYPRQ